MQGGIITHTLDLPTIEFQRLQMQLTDAILS